MNNLISNIDFTKPQALQLGIAANKPVEKMVEKLEAGPQLPTDQLDVDFDPEKKDGEKFSLGQAFRKGFSSVGSRVLALYNGALSIPESAVIGWGAAKGASKEKLRTRAASTNIIVKTAAATAAATALAAVLGGGPVIGGIALGVGLATGLSSSAIGNHIAAFTGRLDAKIDKIASAARGKEAGNSNELSNAKALLGLPKAIGVGASTSANDTRLAGRFMLHGVADGVKFNIENKRGLVSKSHNEDHEDGLIRMSLKTAAGIISGTVGVVINSSCGAVAGALRSLQNEEGAVPDKMTSTLMFLVTNIAKLAPGSAVAGLGGTAGFALGTGTNSITSMIDGKDGFHKGIIRQVDRALEQAHDGKDAVGNMRAYYRAGKGAVVGGMTGLYEGWRVGYESGAEQMDNLLDLGKHSVEIANQEEKAVEEKAAE